MSPKFHMNSPVWRIGTSRSSLMMSDHSFLYVMERGTSPIDWCEFNYTHTPFIAELINTTSNILFLIFPPILCQLFRQYANNIDRGIYIIWTLFAVVGICSAYFHATLSLLGQLLDELAILWLLAFAFGMWLPRTYYPRWIHNDRKKFKKVMMLISVIASFAAFIYPWINSFALMTLGIPTFFLLTKEIRQCRIQRIRRLGWRCCICWIAAVTSWILDRMFCDTWSAYNLPYLHGVWHIMIAIASYTVCVLFAYFDAIHNYQDLLPVIKFWPQDKDYGIPYIELKNAA
ncbi:alkaline ceramidase isoform X1 [Dermatophagoides pteronyssinus]|uniref:Alkaline ceramidase n=3 Tax=Dermatophagoides pteronyssinus TaxID=6956 RepID=A0A6P6XUF1_DERPT|nr:alkaline ceramidase 2-like isoform X1 [Dermatophagoides pteronyssinus]KAH9417710.1 Hydrolyzes the sphingolipid ceramide into sphingosine and free fatty acid [Dermatophagoides pteronyssinus]